MPIEVINTSYFRGGKNITNDPDSQRELADLIREIQQASNILEGSVGLAGIKFGVDSVPPLYDASAVLALVDAGKTHRCEHATVAIELSLPAGEDSILNVPFFITKEGAAFTGFRTTDGNSFFDGTPNGTMQNATAETDRSAWAVYVGNGKWKWGPDIGTWESA